MSFLESLKEWFEGLVEHDDYFLVTVKKGDSLWSIAKKLTNDGLMKKVTGEDGGENYKKIVAANPDKRWTRDYIIQPGEVLKVPKD